MKKLLFLIPLGMLVLSISSAKAEQPLMTESDCLWGCTRCQQTCKKIAGCSSSCIAQWSGCCAGLGKKPLEYGCGCQ
jgi:hypothetical protein